MNGVLTDWIGVTITGHPIEGDDGPQDINAHFELPLTSIQRSDNCGVGTEFSAKYHDCWQLRYGGWFGGEECGKWTHFTSLSQNGQFQELKKEDAVSAHNVF